MTNPSDQVVKRGGDGDDQRYIVVEEDTTEKFMKAVIISLMQRRQEEILFRTSYKGKIRETYYMIYSNDSNGVIIRVLAIRDKKTTWYSFTMYGGCQLGWCVLY